MTESVRQELGKQAKRGLKWMDSAARAYDYGANTLCEWLEGIVLGRQGATDGPPGAIASYRGTEVPVPRLKLCVQCSRDGIEYDRYVPYVKIYVPAMVARRKQVRVLETKLRDRE